MSSSISLNSPTQYIDFCLQEVQPNYDKTFEDKANSLRRISKISMVAYALFAVIGFLAVGVYAPSYLVGAGIATIFGGQTLATKLVSYENEAKEADVRAQQIRDIKQIYDQRFSEISLDRLKESLEFIENNLSRTALVTSAESSDETFQKVKALMARYQYWSDLITTSIDNSNILKQRITAIPLDRRNEQRPEITKIAMEVINEKEKRFHYFLNRCFLLAVLKKGDFAGDLFTLGSLIPISFEDRKAAEEVDDDSADDFFKLQNGNSITRDDLQFYSRETSTYDKLLQAMNAVRA